jgi:hypothetical protein
MPRSTRFTSKGFQATTLMTDAAQLRSKAEASTALGTSRQWFLHFIYFVISNIKTDIFRDRNATS